MTDGILLRELMQVRGSRVRVADVEAEEQASKEGDEPRRLLYDVREAFTLDGSRC